MSKHTPLEKLKHHVSGAIKRGEKTAIEAVVAAKHTPGPWIASPANPEDRTFVTDQNDKLVCFVESGDGDNHKDFANARLIAAAPDLLKALEQVLMDTDDAVYISHFQNLINRARGTGKGVT